MNGKVPENSLTPRQQSALQRIARSRNYLLVCFFTLPLYVAGLLLLLNNGRDINGLMLAYMGIYALFAINMAIRRCPRCNEQFFVRHVFLNVVTRRCTHCGLAINSTHLEKF